MMRAIEVIRQKMTLLTVWLAALLLFACLPAAQAAISLVGIGLPPATGGGAITSLSFSAPAGSAVGDIMLVQITVRGGSNVTTLTPPAGWAIAAARINNGTTLMQVVYYRIRTATESASYTWNFNPGDRASGGLIAFRGVDPVAPINATGGQANAASTSVTAPALVTTVAGTRLVGFYSTASAGASILPPAGMTGHHAMQTGAGPNGVAVEISSATQAAAGNTGTKVASSVTTAAANIGQLVALTPAVVAAANPGRFNIFETATAAGAISGPIRTKLAGTGFSLDIVALNLAKTAVLTTFTGAVKVELLNASVNTGVLDANNCNPSWTVIQTLAANPNFVATDNGRKTVAFLEADAWREVRVRVSYPATGTPTAVGCSTDNFTIRPTGFTSVTSSMTNTGSSGAPKARAGTDGFTLTVATGKANYNGTPKIDQAAVQAHAGAIQNGVLDGVFPAAVTGTATGTNAFTYSEVGNFRLLGSMPTVGDIAARGVYDDDFTEVDKDKGECSDDFSNTVSGGMYGCNFGITANTAYFGRFYPDSFVLTSPAFVNRNDIVGCAMQTIQTTGSIAASSTLLTVASVTGFAPGDAIIVRGAGSSGADLISTVTGMGGTTLTLKSSAASTVAGATVYRPGFSYQNEPMALAFTITALNGLTTPSVTSNYTGIWAGGTVALQAENNNDGINLSARLAANATANWASGIYTLNAVNAQFIRGTAADGPYENLQFGVAVNDPDGPVLLARDMNPVTATDCIASGNCTGVAVANTRILFGRLRLSNAHGSELLNLPVPAETQYWNGAVFVTNTADSCTTLAMTNISLVKSPASCTTALSANAAFAGGRTSLIMSRPNATCRADLSVNLGAVAENKIYLQGKWSGISFNQNPTARATFGIYKRGPLIYMREMY